MCKFSNVTFDTRRKKARCHRCDNRWPLITTFDTTFDQLMERVATTQCVPSFDIDAADIGVYECRRNCNNMFVKYTSENWVKINIKYNIATVYDNETISPVITNCALERVTIA